MLFEKIFLELLLTVNTRSVLLVDMIGNLVSCWFIVYVVPSSRMLQEVTALKTTKDLDLCNSRVSVYCTMIDIMHSSSFLVRISDLLRRLAVLCTIENTNELCSYVNRKNVARMTSI